MEYHITYYHSNLHKYRYKFLYYYNKISYIYLKKSLIDLINKNLCYY